MKTFLRILRPAFKSTCRRSLACRAVIRSEGTGNGDDFFLKRNILRLSTWHSACSRYRYCTQPEANSFHVQDYDDFKERVLNSDTPVIVDFFADWCGPCKLLAPRLESMVDRKGGRVILAKVNVDDNTELAMEYGVRSVPTVIAFKDGQPVDQMIGLTEDEQITSFLNKLTNE